MSWFSKLFGGLFGRKKRPTPTPPVNIYRAVAVTVFADGQPVESANVILDSHPPFHGMTNKAGYVLFPMVPKSLTASHLTIAAAGYHPFSEHVDLAPENHTLRVGDKPQSEWDRIFEGLKRDRPPAENRHGVVVAWGNSFADMNGVFLPFGHTLMWSLRGFKHEPDRIKDNIRWLAQRGFDFDRTLCQVGWTGLLTDPNWPDYEQVLASKLDFTFDECGMRTQLTLIGGGSGFDPMELARKVVRVVREREHKVMYLEVANEWYGNFKDENKLKEIGKFLKDNLPNLVALSAPKEELAGKRSREWVKGGYANMGTAHFDRDDDKADWKWKHVRKPWESRGESFPQSHGEPGGPLSSVAEYHEPIHLAMSRAVSILCGYSSYVLHNGAGIFGVPQQGPTGFRPANVWETPNIEEIVNAVGNIEMILPPNPHQGVPTRKGFDNHPLSADINWPDGGDHGIVRDYAMVQGGNFWQTLIGVKNYVNLRSNGNYSLRIFDPITQEYTSRLVNTGETIRVENSPSRDSRGYGAWIVQGTRR